MKRKIFFSRENFSLGVYALLFAIFVLFMRLLAPNLFWKMFTPLFRVSDTFAAESHSFISRFGNAEILTARNEQLAGENALLANENQMLLQKIADSGVFAGTLAKGGIVAGVVARPPESPYDTLVLAAGENEGVTLGMEAFGSLTGEASASDIPIGVVSSVLADFSRVTLFSAPGTATSGWIGHTAIPVTIFGAGAGAMNVTIERSASIAIGDTVFIPGPGMLPIGKVSRVDGDSSSPAVTLRITSALNLFSIAWVALRDVGGTAFISATSTLP